MSERLNRIEAILEATATQQARHTDEIDTLLGAVSTTEVRVNELVTAMRESNQRFDVLRAEANTDRQETRRLHNEAMARMDADRSENSQRFDVLRAEANADRQETRRLFDEAFTRMDDDRSESSRRFDETLNRIDAQQEVIQRLLVELLNTNRDASKLRDRVDNLEQAS